MRVRRIYPFTVCVMMLFVSLHLCGCASSRSEDEVAARYTANLGTATLYDFSLKTRQILDRYQFQVVRYESTTDLTHFETGWKPRFPFSDEIERGIEEARTRIFIQASPRGRSAGASDLSVVRMEAENQVRLRGSQEWHHAPMSKMLREYLREFSDDLATELRTGLRRF